jgi:hypothetical protein
MENDSIDSCQSSTNKPPSSNDEKSPNEPIEKDNIPSSSGGISKLQPPPSDSNKAKTKKKHRHTRDPGLFWVGCATLIAVSIYAWYARQQAINMEVAAKAARQSAIAAEDAVKVAKDTLRASVEAANRDQRAWVGPIDTTPPPFIEGDRRVYVKEGEAIKIGVVITNSGKTPARKVRSIQWIKSLSAKIPFIPEEFPVGMKGSIAVIHPGMRPTLSTELNIPKTKEFIDGFKNGDLILYVYGGIIYEDIVGQEHKTIYCMKMTKDLTSMLACESYNDAD